MSDTKSVRDLMESVLALSTKKYADNISMINELVKVSVENDLIIEFKLINYVSTKMRNESYTNVRIRRKNNPTDLYHYGPMTNKYAEYLKTGLRKAKIMELENVIG